MDVSFRIGGQEFIWDFEKAAANFDKHRIAFERACEVFFDPLVKYSDAGVREEDRVAALGQDFDHKLMLVVHTEPVGTIYRIISARFATSAESRRYEKFE